MLKKVYIKTYGCQMNVYDSGKMIDVLSTVGYKQVNLLDDADLIVLNTCHIREKAVEKVFSDLGKLRYLKSRKSVVIAVGGCIAQVEKDKLLSRSPYIDIIFTPQTYHKLPQLIFNFEQRKINHEKFLDVDCSVGSKFDFLPKSSEAQGVSAFLTIQEGCDKFCSYCVVPYTRGREYSRTVEDVFLEAKELVKKGVKDITLLGQNVSAYHGVAPFDLSEEWGVEKLINYLSTITGLKRIRYITSHPVDISEDLIVAHSKIDKLMPYLHLPIQSGSNRILKKMNRKYTVEDYLNIISKLRYYKPNIAISSDFIIGYPGETEEDFQQTIELIKKVKFVQSYSFKYSKRKGTLSAESKEQIPEEIKVKRLEKIQELLSYQQLCVYKKSIGSKQRVLFEKVGKYVDQYIGRNEYYQTVYVTHSRNLIGKIANVEIIKASSNSLEGKITD